VVLRWTFLLEKNPNRCNQARFPGSIYAKILLTHSYTNAVGSGYLPHDVSLQTFPPECFPSEKALECFPLRYCPLNVFPSDILS